MSAVILGNRWFHKIFQNLKWKSLLPSPSIYNNLTIIWMFPACQNTPQQKDLSTQNVGTMDVKAGRGPRFIAKLSCRCLQCGCMNDPRFVNSLG